MILKVCWHQLVIDGSPLVGKLGQVSDFDGGNWAARVKRWVLSITRNKVLARVKGPRVSPGNSGFEPPM